MILMCRLSREAVSLFFSELRVETCEVAHFRGLLIVRHGNGARQRVGDDTCRGGEDGVRRELDDLVVPVAFMERRVDVLRHQFASRDGARDSDPDGDWLHVRRRVEQGPFGSDWGNHDFCPYHPGSSQYR